MGELKGTSADLQEITMVSLINDPYLLSKCGECINERYFENKSYKLIFKCLNRYYKKYLKLPVRSELSLMIKDSFSSEYGDLDSVENSLSRLYESPVPDENFVYEKVTEFIRRNNIEVYLSKSVDAIQQSGEINLDDIANGLRDSLNIEITRSQLYNLSDTSRLKEIREEAVGSADSPLLTKFFIDPVNWCMQYGALPPGTLNMIVAPPGRGKTTMMINQGLKCAEQGFNSLHIFLGDMSLFDGTIRYLSCLSGVSTNKLVKLSDDELAKFVRKYNMTGILGNINIISHAAGEFSPSQLVEEIITMQRKNKIHFHQIIIDYDENFATEVDSMYESGGNVYNRLALFAVMNKSVVFILCQPKPTYWNYEVIPMEAAAESSKKQKIIDLMLTIGRPAKDSEIGTLNIAKNRRGQDSKLVRLRFHGENARIEAITEEEYNNLKKGIGTKSSNE